LFRGCLWSNNIKVKSHALKADRHLFCDAKRSSKVQVSLRDDFNALGWDAHRCSDHLASYLRASRQSPKQKVTGTGACTGASDSLVGLSIVDGASDIDRAGDRTIRLSAFRP
jgi:hypothetical protein